MTKTARVKTGHSHVCKDGVRRAVYANVNERKGTVTYHVKRRDAQTGKFKYAPIAFRPPATSRGGVDPMNVEKSKKRTRNQVQTQALNAAMGSLSMSTQSQGPRAKAHKVSPKERLHKAVREFGNVDLKALYDQKGTDLFAGLETNTKTYDMFTSEYWNAEEAVANEHEERFDAFVRTYEYNELYALTQLNHFVKLAKDAKSKQEYARKCDDQLDFVWNTDVRDPQNYPTLYNRGWPNGENTRPLKSEKSVTIKQYVDHLMSMDPKYKMAAGI